MINFHRSKAKFKFRAAAFKESKEHLSNPGRGWYRLYAFPIEAPVKEEEIKAVICKEEQLAMVQIDIVQYRNTVLDSEALMHLRQILEFFKREEKELILRFVYDREGKGMEHEPSGIELIQLHMKQIGTILQEYSDHILTLQGLFIGSWGEMHNSKFLTQNCLKMLTQTLYEATGGSLRFAVRRPKYLRMLFTEHEITENVKKPEVGLYNDGMCASESDLGTYGTGPKRNSGWEDAWCREDELNFQDGICQTVPNGGEVVEDNPLNDLEHAIADLQKMHVTYLHSLYDRKVLEKWNTTPYDNPGVFQGTNGYYFIGEHLGYRFVVKEAFLEKSKRQTLIIKVSNVGFANSYDRMQVSVLWKVNNNILKESPVFADVRDWRSNEVCSLSVEPEVFNDIEVDVWLQIKRCKDNKTIQFANVDAGEAVRLGKLSYGKATEKIAK